jgi:hypothetical protein
MTEPRSITAMFLECIEHFDSMQRKTPWMRKIITDGYAALAREARVIGRPVEYDAAEIRELYGPVDKPLRSMRAVAKIVGCSVSTVKAKLDER